MEYRNRNIGHADDVPQSGQTTATNRRQTSKVKSRGHELWIHADKLVDTSGQSCGHTRTTLPTLADKVADKLVDTRTKLRTKLRTNLRTHADKAVDTRGQSCGHTRTSCGQSCGHMRTNLRTHADKVADKVADTLVQDRAFRMPNIRHFRRFTKLLTQSLVKRRKGLMFGIRNARS